MLNAMPMWLVVDIIVVGIVIVVVAAAVAVAVAVAVVIVVVVVFVFVVFAFVVACNLFRDLAEQKSQAMQCPAILLRQ